MLDIADLIYKEYSENYSSNSPNFKARQEKEFAALKALTDTLTKEQQVLLNDFFIFVAQTIQNILQKPTRFY